ncbi:MAG: hypothetical protein ACYC69_15660, partial [Thermodesulfovibrionales bacterium]
FPIPTFIPSSISTITAHAKATGYEVSMVSSDPLNCKVIYIPVAVSLSTSIYRLNITFEKNPCIDKYFNNRI